MKFNRILGIRILIVISVAVILIMIGAEFYDRLTQKPKIIEQRAVPVEVVPARKGPITQWVLGEGIARAVRRRSLDFEESGKVVFIAKDLDGRELREGSRVKGPEDGRKKGQLLARLDSRIQTQIVEECEAELAQARMHVEEYKSALALAHNNLALQTAEFRRMIALHRRGAISDSSFEKIRNNFRNAREAVGRAEARHRASEDLVGSKMAALIQARVRLEKLSFHAPFDGIVGRINIREGEYVTARVANHKTKAEAMDAAAIVLLDTTSFEIMMDLPDFDGLLVKEGLRAYISWPNVGRFHPHSLTNANVTTPYAEGRVFAVAPAVLPENRTVRVRVRASNVGDLFHDGDFVSVWIAVKERPSAVIVPNRAILYRRNKPFLFTADRKTGTAVLKSIRTGIEDVTHSEIVSGIGEGELVVTLGRQRLDDGSGIRIVSLDGGSE